MMKKQRLKSWVVQLLFAIPIIAYFETLYLLKDFNTSVIVSIISGIISMIIVYLSGSLFEK